MPASSVNEVLLSGVLRANSGVFLFVTLSETLSESTLRDMKRAACCSSTALIDPEYNPECKCASCLSIIDNERHPNLQSIDVTDFDNQMLIAYAYPAKVVAIGNVDKLSFQQQMQLLIWLEVNGRSHKILLTATNTAKILPTIVSRAMVFTAVVKLSMDPEIKERAVGIIHRLLKGDLRLDDQLDKMEGMYLAQAMQEIMLLELERRLVLPSRKSLDCSNAELYTLTKLVSKYLENPLIHNLTLLLRSFQMLSLQNIR